ncbi:MAG: glucosidase, partial [Phycisphaerales bacterium]
DRLPGFKKRMKWFLDNRKDLSRHISYMSDDGPDAQGGQGGHGNRLPAIPSRERRVRVLRYRLAENEFLSPFGIRSLSKVHMGHPYIFRINGDEHRVDYCPGESNTSLFGGNSNWRGPIWFPLNFLIVEVLERYYHFYGDELQVECPTGSGNMLTLLQVASEIRQRLASLFLPDKEGIRPAHRGDLLLASDPNSRDLVLFHEHFHGESGRGLGATHQTGWTALIASMLD